MRRASGSHLGGFRSQARIRLVRNSLFAYEPLVARPAAASILVATLLAWGCGAFRVADGAFALVECRCQDYCSVRERICRIRGPLAPSTEDGGAAPFAIVILVILYRGCALCGCAGGGEEDVGSKGYSSSNMHLGICSITPNIRVLVKLDTQRSKERCGNIERLTRDSNV